MHVWKKDLKNRTKGEEEDKRKLRLIDEKEPLKKTINLRTGPKVAFDDMSKAYATWYVSDKSYIQFALVFEEGEGDSLREIFELANKKITVNTDRKEARAGTYNFKVQAKLILDEAFPAVDQPIEITLSDID